LPKSLFMCSNQPDSFCNRVPIRTEQLKSGQTIKV